MYTFISVLLIALAIILYTPIKSRVMTLNAHHQKLTGNGGEKIRQWKVKSCRYYLRCGIELKLDEIRHGGIPVGGTHFTAGL